MHHRDFPRFRRRDRYGSQETVGEEQASPSGSEEWREHLASLRPAWWPENEPWPPQRHYWRRSTHRPFMRRLGCVFLLLNFIGAVFFVGVVLLVLNGLGVGTSAVRSFQWVAPIAGALLAALVTMVVVAGASLRRFSAPLDEMLDASHRLAEGDYSARVAIRGPSEVRSLASAFNSMAERLHAHETQRRSMLADITHELRTPLTVMQGNIEGMLDGIYPPDAARLGALLEEIHVLSRLTDDLRTLSMAESGTLELKREQTDLTALARDAVAAFQSQAESSGVRLELSAPDADLLMNIDPERIRQVLGNLVSNALRYSPRGTAVRVVLAQEAGSARVSVVDSGPGISSADLPHVFDRYFKTADSRGMGLGLSIARYIVEAHGGTIMAESAAGAGTTFSFALPG